MYALTGMVILNGHKGMKPIRGKSIIVDNETIVDIVDDANLDETIEKIDLSGKYLLPGLIDLHVHIPSTGKPTKKRIDYEKLAKLLRFGIARKVIQIMCKNSARAELNSGTTTIRAVGGVLNFDTDLRNQINSGTVVGPRILAADYAISVPGGHMTGSVALPAHSVEEAVQMVHELDKNKPDLIKLMITGGILDAKVVGEPGDMKMPPEMINAVVAEAHKLGYKVAAHVESQEGVIAALESGVDTIEHGGKPSEKVIDLLKQTGSKVIATISPVIPFLELDQKDSGCSDTDIINAKALYENMVELYNECLDNGIPVGIGTDTGCPFVTHYDTWRELVYFCRDCNVTPSFAIYSATLLNAQIANIDNITGSVDVGKSADFMVVDKNPIKDLTALRNPCVVFFRGQQIDISKQKKIPLVEKLLG